jgi:hypothetical protein
MVNILIGMLLFLIFALVEDFKKWNLGEGEYLRDNLT